MDWYQIYAFRDRVKAIEHFFVEIAAQEDFLSRYGMKHAFGFDGAETAIEALTTFSEDYSSLKRQMQRIDRTIGAELAFLDTDGKLIEQVALISLKLRMSHIRGRSNFRDPVMRLSQYFPYLAAFTKSKGLFGEEPVSLQKTIINIGRLRGIVNSAHDVIRNIGVSDDEVFKPSNVDQDRVVDMIDSAIAEIEGLMTASPTERQRLIGYLQEAKTEALSPTPSWSKIIGALVIAAAITSGLADGPNAAKNLKTTIEYILGSSVEKQLPRYLPAPEQDNAEPESSSLLEC